MYGIGKAEYRSPEEAVLELGSLVVGSGLVDVGGPGWVIGAEEVWAEGG